MPEISRFLGIVIYLYFNDHPPPHFHVKYNEYRAKIAIDNLSLLESSLPSRVLGLVIEWAEIHKTELLTNWESLSKNGTFNRIAPLA